MLRKALMSSEDNFLGVVWVVKIGSLTWPLVAFLVMFLVKFLVIGTSPPLSAQIACNSAAMALASRPCACSAGFKSIPAQITCGLPARSWTFLDSQQ